MKAQIKELEDKIVANDKRKEELLASNDSERREELDIGLKYVKQAQALDAKI